MTELFYLLGIALLTYCSGYFSGSEIALFSLPSTKVKSFKYKQNVRKNLIAKLLSRPRDLLVTILLVNTLVNILLQNVASSMFGPQSSLWLKIGVPLIITLILGEIIPKNIAMHNNVRFAESVAPTIDFFNRNLKWVRDWIVKIATPISKVMFFFLKREKSISMEEMQHVLHTSKEFGVLHHDEVELIEGYLDLQTTQATEVMRPRKEVLFYNIEEPLSKLTHLFVEEEVTRVPVCDKTLDEVIGILSAKQFFIQRDQFSVGEDIIPYLKKPFYLPESMPAKLVLKRLEDSDELIALLVDEHRSISGLISREDLMELIVGPIADRRDEKPKFTRNSKTEIIASGKMELSTLEDLFSTSFESPNHMITLGGWLTERMGEIPKSGSTYENQDFLFNILSSDQRRVHRVYIRQKRGGLNG